MEQLYYIGLDVHKKMIAYCVKDVTGAVIDQGAVSANRASLGQWVVSLQHPWVGAMEATLFTGWIYDFLKPYAVELKVAHPEMLKAISASKKKNDRDDAADRMAAGMTEVSRLVRILDAPGRKNRNAIVMAGDVKGLRKPSLVMRPQIESGKIAKALDSMRFRPRSRAAPGADHFR